MKPTVCILKQSFKRIVRTVSRAILACTTSRNHGGRQGREKQELNWLCKNCRNQGVQDTRQYGSRMLARFLVKQAKLQGVAMHGEVNTFQDSLMSRSSHFYRPQKRDQSSGYDPFLLIGTLSISVVGEDPSQTPDG